MARKQERAGLLDNSGNEKENRGKGLGATDYVTREDLQDLEELLTEYEVERSVAQNSHIARTEVKQEKSLELQADHAKLLNYSIITGLVQTLATVVLAASVVAVVFGG